MAVSECTIERQVEFAETDLAGLVHFSQFFRYMEAGEHALWRAAGLSVAPQNGPLASYGWPRVAARCEYRAPLRFEDRFAITVFVREIKRRVLHFGCVMRKLDHPQLVAEGCLTAVCVQTEGETLRSVLIPPPVENAFEEARKERLVELGFQL